MTRICLCLLLCFLTSIVAATRIKDMIYMPIDGVSACFRRHNGTHQFGCSSERSGSVGVIHIIEQESDLRWIEQNATAGFYSVVLQFDMFNRENLVRLRNTGIINGVLLADNITTNAPSFYSPEDTCPNRYSGIKESCSDEKPWNPKGSSLLLEDWPFPMFFLQNDTLLEEIKSCYLKHNAHSQNTQSERSLCALEMKSFMIAAVNSESCLMRSKSFFNSVVYCDPMGDRNIHWALKPLEKQIESVIMVIARLDANSMYNDLVPGADSAITGLATLMATAYYLKQLNPTVDKTNVVFSILNGESLDYIGSSRLVYDLKENQFHALGEQNLTLDHISGVVELGQLRRNTKQQIYLHASNYDKFEIVSRLASNLSAKILPGSVPPASIQRFLKEKSHMPVVVIASHGATFENNFYESMLDDATRVGYQSNPKELILSLMNVSIGLGNELYRTATGNTPLESEVAAHTTAVQKLLGNILDCYLVSAKCELFEAASAPDTKISDYLLPLYINVARTENPSTYFTSQVMKLLTGDKVSVKNASECHDQNMEWVSGFDSNGTCINATVNYSAAVSPAFIIPDYDFKSGLYSTWTESVWETFGVRMFLKPSPAAEKLSMILGGTTAVVSFVLVWFINSRASILFDSR